MYYYEVLKALNKARVDYLVVGGVALVLHGVVRMTADLDIVLDQDEKNIKKYVSVVKELGYKPKVPVRLEEFVDLEKRRQWVEEKNMKVFSVYDPATPYLIVDVLMDPGLEYGKLKGDSVIFKAKGIRIPVISIKDLKEMKGLAGRAQDLADIKALDEMESVK